MTFAPLPNFDSFAFDCIDYSSDHLASSPTTTTTLTTPPCVENDVHFYHHHPSSPAHGGPPPAPGLKPNNIHHYDINEYALLGYNPHDNISVLPPPPTHSIYPTPAESPLDYFETPNNEPCSDFDAIFADLLAFDTKPAPQPFKDEPLTSVFGDLPLFDPADSLFPTVPQAALFPDLDNNGFAAAAAAAPKPAATSVTLSLEQLSALLQAAAESGGPSASASVSAAAPAAAAAVSPTLSSSSAFDDSQEESAASPLSPDTTPKVRGSSSRRRLAKYTCPHPGCGKQFTRHFNLKSHLPLHDPARPRLYDCKECNKSFFKQNDLARHANTHTAENQCECSCGKRYSRVDALKRHVKSTGCPNPVFS
ncbi:hypothetical protein HDU87_005909 [Geranomyces variabilis]|uniref:C2H2-type domain-containing protein n=1 Tax=Geranomyces variabilis TaxID=109894 RepID=A0AAD5TQ28_9FUNG|nr:hypothetical protein HDU87_005909 [Geranomyces variabilis]